MPDPAERSAALWADFSGRVAALRDLVFAGMDDDELHHAEGSRYLLRFLAAGMATCIEHDDTDHPELGTLIENRRSWGLDNPDTKYGFCRLAPGATYRVTGDPGTACRLELQVDTGHFADGRFAEWRCLSRLDDRDLVTDEHGRVEVLIAPERPVGAVNWMATGPEASFLHVREYFADWSVERPAVLAVERVGAALPAGPLGLDELEARMALLGQWLESGARCWADLGRGLAGGEPGPITPFVPPPGATGLGGQAYGMGAYRCEADEAVLVELEPPPCHYWSLSLATWFWESADVANRCCSVNHSQAAVDPDGVVRAVIAHQDPGVANWLDPAGYRRGTLAVRYLDAASLPAVTQRRVPLAELDANLPDSTRRVTAEERAEALRVRREALVWRYRR